MINSPTKIITQEEKDEKLKSLLQKSSKKRWDRIKNLLINKTPFQISEQLFLELLPKLSHDTYIEYYPPNSQKQTIEDNYAFSAIILKHQNSISIDEIKSFNQQMVDSTGIALWPAEEALAYFSIKNIDKINSFHRFIELGAGYSGMATLILAKQIFKFRLKENQKLNQNLQQDTIIQTQQQKQQESEENKEIQGVISQNTQYHQYQNNANQDYFFLITDGNDLCSQQLEKNIEINKESFSTIQQQYQEKYQNQLTFTIKSQKLVWSKNFQLQQTNQQQKFECILVADCLFFKNYHQELIITLQELIEPEYGICWIVAPNRGDSIQIFLDLASPLFEITFIEFDDEIYNLRMNKVKASNIYDSDRHEMKFIELRLKKNKLSNKDKDQINIIQQDSDNKNSSLN